MPLLVQRVGRERLYAEAVESHIGGWFWNAATRARVNPIAHARVRVRPADVATSEDWRSRPPSRCSRSPSRPTGRRSRCRSTRPRCRRRRCRPSSSRCSERSPSSSPSRAARRRTGDTVVVDLIAEDGSAQRDYVVELGSGAARRGDRERHPRPRRRRAAARSPTSSPTADAATATVALKELKERVLPPLDDELAARRPREFDTLAELRADIESRLRAQIEDEIEGMFRAAAVDELVRASNFVGRGPARRGANPRAARPVSHAASQARGIDASHLPAADRPDAGDARAASARRGVALGLARARARGGRRQARHRRSPTTRSARSCAPPARPTRTSRSSSPRAAPTASATTSA